MGSIQGTNHKSHISNNTEAVLASPISHGASCVISQPTASGVHRHHSSTSNQSEGNPPTDIIEILRVKGQGFRSRFCSLYDQLPTISSLLNNLDQAFHRKLHQYSSHSRHAEYDLESCQSCQYGIIHYEQQIRIWSHTRQDSKDYRTLLDTAACINLILRSVVDDLELQTYEEHETLESIDGVEFDVSTYVQPKWQLHMGQIWHQKFSFFVVDKLPDSVQIVVGHHTINDIGISLRANKRALPLFVNGAKDRNIQKLPEHTNQILDGAARQAQRRETFNRALADATESSERGKPQHGTSQQLAQQNRGSHSKSSNQTSQK